MESTTYQKLKKEILNDLTKFAFWRLESDLSDLVYRAHTINLFDGKSGDEQSLIRNYYLNLLNFNYRFNIPRPSYSVRFPPFLENNILLVRCIAAKLFMDWFFDNYHYQLDNNKISNDNNQFDIIKNKCHNLIEEWFDENASYFIDIEKLALQDPASDYGEIKWFEQEKGFGVIKANGKEYFVHHTNILCDRNSLKIGTLVKFKIRQRKYKNGYEAFEVKILQKEDHNEWLDIDSKNIVDFYQNYRDFKRLIKLSPGELLFLKLKSNQPQDQNFIVVETNTGEALGYFRYPNEILAKNIKYFDGFIPAWITKNDPGGNRYRTLRKISVSFPINDFSNTEIINDVRILCEKFANDALYKEKPKDLVEDGSEYWYSNFKVSSSPKDVKVNEITTNVVGVTFEGRQSIVAQLQVGEQVILEREPSNFYDQNAIMVLRMNGQQIGYIKKEMAARLAKQLDQCAEPVQGKVKELTGGYYHGSSLGVIISFSMPNNVNFTEIVDY